MFFIAEIGSNWAGNLDLAKETILACKKAGADVVKFQLWDADIIYKGKYKEFQMSFEQFEILYRYSKEIGITCFATPSYPEAVDFLESLHVPLYKIASVTSGMKHVQSFEVMKRVSNTGKPVLISYGYGDKTGCIFNNTYVLKFDCVPKYPATIEDYSHIKAFYNLSDHTIGTGNMFDYLNLNPNCIIEKHIKLKDNPSPDSPFSLYTDELADFITLSKSSLVRFG